MRSRRAARRKAGREPSPSAAVIDSQNGSLTIRVKTSYAGGERGFDGAKRITGRKRHVLTDTLRLLLAVLVHRADEGYAGTPPGLVRRVFGWRWSLVRRERPGFVVLPKRWVDWAGYGPERTFAWLGGYRRLSKDYERLCLTSEAMVQLSAIRLRVRRLA